MAAAKARTTAADAAATTESVELYAVMENGIMHATFWSTSFYQRSKVGVWEWEGVGEGEGERGAMLGVATC